MRSVIRPSPFHFDATSSVQWEGFKLDVETVAVGVCPRAADANPVVAANNLCPVHPTQTAFSRGSFLSGAKFQGVAEFFRRDARRIYLEAFAVRGGNRSYLQCFYATLLGGSF
jgi:hypothetical protein